MTERLLAPTFLFRFQVPCRHLARPWSPEERELPEMYSIPSFCQLDDRPVFTDIRVGWSREGLSVSLRVRGKKQPVWCQELRPLESDGLSLWIDTRDTQNIHQASRFCHWFRLLPHGASGKRNRPLANLLPIPRARANPNPISPDRIEIRSEQRIDGYLLCAHLPAETLTGYDPVEYPRLGFTYAVTDRELGWQTFTVGPEFPFTSDPSLWGSLELVGP
jgi:hypothetical protein